MTSKETEVLTAVIGKLTVLFDESTEQISTARKVHLTGLLKRRDDLAALIRDLHSLH